MSKIMKNCIICKKEIKRGLVKFNSSRRSSNSVTCSKECSKVYQRCYHYIKTKI